MTDGWRNALGPDVSAAKYQGSRSEVDRLRSRISELEDAVDLARQGRDLAEQLAKEAVQAEMAALRKRIAEARLELVAELPEEEVMLMALMPTLRQRVLDSGRELGRLQ